VEHREQAEAAILRRLEEDRTAICGHRYQHQVERPASRAGTVPSEVVLGGRKVALRRPRVRANGAEVPLPTFQAMANEDPLNRRVVEQMLVGVATRQYARSLLLEDDASDVEAAVLVSEACLFLAVRRVEIRIVVDLAGATDAGVKRLRGLVVALQSVGIEQVTIVVHARAIVAFAQVVPRGSYINPPACCLLLANVREGSRAGNARGDSGVAVEGRVEDRRPGRGRGWESRFGALESAELWVQPAC
jgi:hypothetical protein